MSGQVQATEIPHQVPEDDGVLAKELVGVDHLDGQEDVRITEQQTSHDVESCVPAVRQTVYLIPFVLQQGLQLLTQHQRAEVWNRHRLGVWSFGANAILTNTDILPIVN